MKKLLLFLLMPVLALADTTISSLPAITTVGSGTLLPVVDVSGTLTTKKSTVSQLVTGLPNATGGQAGLLSTTFYGLLNGATSSSTASTLMLRDASANTQVNEISINGTPTNPTDAATKSYVDAVSAGLNIHVPVVAATVGGNITLAGGTPGTLDGVTLHVNDRVLVKNQSDGTQNGIYFVQTLGTGANGTWARTTDANSGSNLTTGSYVFTTGGTVNANAAYTMVTPGPIVIGTSTITWNLFSQVTQIQAANVIGQLVASQIADANLTVAKFAAGIQPVAIVSSLPSPSGYTGVSVVYNTSDGKLYRYSSGAWTTAVPSTDLTGQINGSTQIQSNSISTGQIAAGAITTTQIAAGAVTAGDIAANAVTAGTIAAGAVSSAQISAGAITTTQLAAGAVTASNIASLTITAGQIAAGVITADKMNINNLSAISANIGTITSGSLTASTSIVVGTGAFAVNISASGMTVGGTITFNGDGVNPGIRVIGVGSFTTDRIDINSDNSSLPPYLQFTHAGSSALSITTTGGITSTLPVTVSASGNTTTVNTTDVTTHLVNVGGGSGDAAGGITFQSSNHFAFTWDGSNVHVWVDGNQLGTIPNP